MTQDIFRRRNQGEEEGTRRKTGTLDGGAAMRIIVPLQGVIQGRGGLVLGFVAPCALFYFLQLFFRRYRSSSSPPPAPPSRSVSSSQLAVESETQSQLGSLVSLRGSSGPAYISSRALSLRKTGNSEYYVGLKEYLDNPYDPVMNPNGVIQLGLADNKLTLDLIGEWMSNNMRRSLLGDDEVAPLSMCGIAGYQRFDGLPEMKYAVAGFMNQVLNGKVSFNPSQIILTAGATPSIEILSYCLADPGNAFLVPSPYYPGFDRDIKFRSGVEMIPVPCRSTDSFNISITALDRAYTQAKKRGLKVRALLLSNPSNPVGNLISRDLWYSLLDFSRERDIHLISDEIFAGSVYGDGEFVSVAEVLSSGEFDKSRVHIIYGLSKDMCLAGFRVGVLYSYNESVLAAATRLARFCPVSAPTQRLMTSMLSDRVFIAQFLRENRERLTKMHGAFVGGLKELGIECTKSVGGFYCWADMSHLIRSYSEKGEIELWKKLLYDGGVNVTPGSSCHSIEPGWFRCCFTMLSEEELGVAMERIRKVAENCKSRS
ncbi:hypothetical protein AMTRI_Chr09g22110 [Amborella trichopoda]|uniref:Aminotransferase class I/classII large domain-containing protein n=2 Tax=Amborella trichopoda TaxID=13333 RepID=U5DAG2_AMBTC|nr:probable aminotransferase ACS12 isoform X2 [Amborella trichopoda]ERN19494.1 hypothetical protein AMTR_s00069p00200530 [Amborella trichopoda]|eukprot:XP_006858027.1 probable aminotransferase ACS12 isoform X2 [Amborella trichopoda]